MERNDVSLYKKVKTEDLESITEYIDNSRYTLMDWLDQNPDTPLPAGFVAALIRSITASIHASHSSLLRPYHDTQWVQQFGDNLNYPIDRKEGEDESKEEKNQIS